MTGIMLGGVQNACQEKVSDKYQKCLLSCLEWDCVGPADETGVRRERWKRGGPAGGRQSYTNAWIDLSIATKRPYWMAESILVRALI